MLLAYDGPAGLTSIHSTGHIEPIVRSLYDELVAVQNVYEIGSLAAALLVVSAAVDIPAGGDAVDRAILSTLDAADVATTRRAAAELSRTSCSDRIAMLPLSETERTWWRAIAHLTRGDVDGAIAHLQFLPIDRYPDATSILLSCVPATSDERARAAAELLEARMAVAGGGVRTAARLAGHDEQGWEWIDDPTRLGPNSDAGDAGFAELEVLRFLISGTNVGRRIAATPGVPLELLDDALERNARLELASLQTLEDEWRVYLTARTAPETLTDEEIAALGFEAEQVRRSLASGTANASHLDLADSYLQGLVALAASGEVTDAVRARHPDLAAEVERFLVNPAPELLTETIADDTSLWPLVSRRLGIDSLGWNPSRGSRARALLAWHALSVSTHELQEARWQSALDAAKHALRLSDDEALRDEALNVMACAHWHLGNDDVALQALTTALEGNRNPSLQVNLSVVAGSLDPETAALELARLVRESSSLDLRTTSALRAVALWLTDDVPWVSEREQGMPDPLVEALRTVVVEPIDLDAFRRIIRLQSTFDDDWLANPVSLSSSPHANSLEATIYRARATDASTLVDALTEALRRGDPPVWVVEERDSLLKMLIGHALEDDSGGAAVFAYFAMERGLPVEPTQRDLLIPLAVHGVCTMVAADDSDAAPNDKFTTLLADGERDARQRGTFDGLSEIYEDAWRRLAISHALFGQKFLLDMAKVFDDIMMRIGGVSRHRLNMSVVRDALRPIKDAAADVERSLRAFPSRVTDAEVSEFVDQVLSNARLLAREAENRMK